MLCSPSTAASDGVVQISPSYQQKHLFKKLHSRVTHIPLVRSGQPATYWLEWIRLIAVLETGAISLNKQGSSQQVSWWAVRVTAQTQCFLFLSWTALNFTGNVQLLIGSSSSLCFPTSDGQPNFLNIFIFPSVDWLQCHDSLPHLPCSLLNVRMCWNV